jgi:hypothetical protein
VTAGAVREQATDLRPSDEDDADRQSGSSPPNPPARARRPQARCSEGGSVLIRQYLYIEQLAQLTPWTAGRIRNMICDGTFREGTHYFRPNGPGSRPIFSWRALVDFIEGANLPEVRIEVAPIEVIDDDTRKARALLS